MNNDHNGRHILVVDDEPLIRNSLSEFLTGQGYAVNSAGNGKEAMDIISTQHVDIVITDMRMPVMDGMQLIKNIKKEQFNTAVILITSFGSIDDAVAAMKAGAYNYITKPINDDEIKIVIEHIINERKLKEENVILKEQLSASSYREVFHNIIGKSSKMQKIYSLIEAILKTRSTVLITGESGTGKRLIAHAIHKYNVVESGKPFVEVSCGALTETLLESELFGHVKGAFTGAIKDKIGRFELANGGTIFLDEIDAFTPILQVKLLRVLQNGEFERVGESETIKVDVRVIAATNQKLPDLITQGKFRTDLYYRLNIISIDVPALRERKEDIPILVDHLLKKHAKQNKKQIEGMNPDVLDALMNHQWPGNIRELENVIERAVVLSTGPVINLESLPENFIKSNFSADSDVDKFRLKSAMQDPERLLIVRALDSVSWNRNEAARALGINRTTLYKKMSKFGLLRPRKK